MIAGMLHGDYPSRHVENGPKQLYGFAKTCRTLYAVACPFLFQRFTPRIGPQPSDRLAHLDANHVKPYIRTVQDDPLLGSYLRLCNLRNATDQSRANLGKEQLDYVKRLCDAMGNLLLKYAFNTRELYIPYPYASTFLHHPWPQLNVLHVSTTDRCIGIYRPWEYRTGLTEGLDVSFLPQFLEFPKLRELHITTTFVSGTNAVDDMAPRFSPLKLLFIATNQISDETMAAILRAPVALQSFNLVSHLFDPLEFDARESDHPFVPSYVLPSLTTIYESLKQHTDSLFELQIPGHGYAISQSLNVGQHSLRAFSNLEVLQCDVAFLLGWQNCYHIRKPSSEQSTLKPRKLGTLLPSLLKTLVLFIDLTYRERWGDDFIYKLMQGIVDERQRLKELQLVYLTIEYPHCMRCYEHLYSIDAGPEEERAQIEALMKGVGIETTLEICLKSTSCLNAKTIPSGAEISEMAVIPKEM